jgi:hypothetical protein
MGPAEGRYAALRTLAVGTSRTVFVMFIQLSRFPKVTATLFLGCILVAFGCGGGDDRSPQAVEWGVSRQVSSRQIKLVTSVDYCGGDPAPTIERPVIKYSGKRVFIELFLGHAEDRRARVAFLRSWVS